MEEVINLFKKFDRYKNKTDEELKYYLEPSIKLNQFKKFYENNQLIGFVNWAYIHELVEKDLNKQARLNLTNGNLVIIYG